MQTIITRGNRAVVITSNETDGPFSSRVWVNARKGIIDADATLIAAKHNTLQGALRWADKQLASA